MIRQADAEDAAIIHKIMLSAFEEYRHTDAPSGALKETVSSIEASLKKWLRKSLLYYLDGVPEAEQPLFISRPIFTLRPLHPNCAFGLSNLCRQLTQKNNSLQNIFPMGEACLAEHTHADRQQRMREKHSQARYIHAKTGKCSTQPNPNRGCKAFYTH
ncbi:hypothetical protein Clst_1136 [Thermoclostridium stercorarium subsp. stercorarium DSM 8532]|nr:hypothetical protein Clst_1136 [Thermoclostridium stercorarium subsp. stercorarium DSM 8532]